MTGFKDVSIVVACRNEEQSVERCVRALAAAVPGAEIVVVDGGTDRTFDLVQAMEGEFPRVRAIRNENDRGKGHAIKTGIACSSSPVIAQFDADMQFFAEDLPALISPVLLGESDLCLGSRFLRESDRSDYSAIWARDAGNRLLSLYISLLVSRRVTDVTAGVKVWTRDAIRRIDFRDDAYSYEAELIVRAARLGMRICEVPVRYASRTAGESMHRGNLALARAGLVIMGKALAARLR